MALEKGIVVEKHETDSLEHKVYSFIDSLSEYLPIANDRARLSYDFVKYFWGENDTPEIILKKNKVKIENITFEELVEKISKGLEEIK